jgi:hypothetical protein
MFSIVYIVLSSLVLSSVPSFAAPVGTRDIHVRALRDNLTSARAVPVPQEEAPVARSVLPDTSVVNAATGASNVHRAVDEDWTVPLLRHHARDFFRPTPDNIPVRRRIVFARDDVEARHTSKSHDVKKNVVPEPPAKRDAVPDSPVKRDIVAEPEVKREVSAEPAVKRDVIPEPEAKRDETKRAVIPAIGQIPRNKSTNSTEVDTVPVTKRDANSTSTEHHHQKRGPINFIASFKRELESLD